jgi:hypothetical protein
MCLCVFIYILMSFKSYIENIKYVFSIYTVNLDMG